MKKLLFLLAITCLTTFAATAQYGTLTIRNESLCTIYLEVRGSTGGCTADYTSNLLAIPATSIVTYNNPALVPGGMVYGMSTLSNSDFFTAVKISNADPGTCGTYSFFQSYIVSDCVAGSVIGVPSVQFFDGGCSPCPAAGTTYNIMWGTYSATHAYLKVW